MAQETSSVRHFHGRWRGIHPFQISLHTADSASLHLPDNHHQIPLMVLQQGAGYRCAEVSADGSITGYWTIQPQDSIWIGRWENYDRSQGATSDLSSHPYPTPDLLHYSFQIRREEETWWFSLYTLPGNRVLGTAWSPRRRGPWKVRGSSDPTRLAFDLLDTLYNPSYRVEIDLSRRGWRSGRFISGKRSREKVRPRNVLVIPSQIRHFLDFTRELLILTPRLDWPAATSFLDEHLQQVQDTFAQQFAALDVDIEEPLPFHRQRIRLYAYVQWTYLQPNWASGHLVIQSSWGNSRQIPFTWYRKTDHPLTLRDLWPERPLPRGIRRRINPHQLIPALDLGDLALTIHPDYITVYTPQGPVRIAARYLREQLPRGHALHRVFPDE